MNATVAKAPKSVRDRPSNDRPTLSLTGVDRDRTYFYWQWLAPNLSMPNVYTIERDELDGVLARLSNAIPVRRAGEDDREMLTRILTQEAFAVPAAERALSTELASVLLPDLLANEIAKAFVANGRRPILLRLMPSAFTAQVPWELFPVDVPTAEGGTESLRLIELADIVQEVPAGIHAGRGRVPDAPSDEETLGDTLFVIDPKTGLRDVGSVLYPIGHDAFRTRVGADGHIRSKVDAEFTRKHLHLALTANPKPRRLMYVGHVVMSEESPGATSLLISDPYNMFGITPTLGVTNRPLSALDLLEGTKNSPRRLQFMNESEDIRRADVQWPAERGLRQSGAEIWPMPSRVALVACNSGTDLRSPEPFGLALALINAGAEIVTATKWTLPTDRAFRELAGATTYPLLETALALDDAHSTNDPVARIATWQREQVTEWQLGNATGVASPLLWAAFSTYIGSKRAVESVLPSDDMARRIVGD